MQWRGRKGGRTAQSVLPPRSRVRTCPQPWLSSRTAACQPSEAHCSARKRPPAQEMAPRVRRPRELRICLMGCALAVAAGWLLACNHSVRHRDKEHDSREDQTERRQARAERAGPGPGASAYIRSVRTRGGGWGTRLHALLSAAAPEQHNTHRPPPPPPAPSLQDSVRIAQSLGFSCAPIKGFAGLMILGNSVQMLCSSQRGGGENPLTGY